MTFLQIKAEHTKILAEEVAIQTMDLMVKYHRGMLYLAANKSVGEEKNYKKLFYEELGVVYQTALRYMTFALLMKKFPHLMYSQLQKHNKRILSLLEKEGDLRDRLAQPIIIRAEGQDWNLNPSSVAVGVPKENFSTDPDLMYEGAYYQCDDEAVDSQRVLLRLPSQEEVKSLLTETPPDDQLLEMEISQMKL
jgi:hypothetical protein